MEIVLKTDERFNTLKRWILTSCVIALISSFSSCVNVMTGYEVYTFPLSYLFLLISTLLIFANVRLGYYLLLATALFWAIQLTESFGWFVTFGTNRLILIFLLLTPFLIFLLLIPLTTKYLALNKHYEKILLIISVLVSISFPIYAFVERLNKDYFDSVFAEFRIQDDDSVNIECKPQPSDTRQFLIKTKSAELISAIKSEGTYLHEYYYVSNTFLKLNFKFNDLHSITLIQLGDRKIQSEITWSKDEIEGNTSFLQR